MKKLLAAMSVALLMMGCGEDSPSTGDPTLDEIIAEAIDGKTLRVRGKEGEELSYAPNQETPYTGWAKEMYDNGVCKALGQFKDGSLEEVSEWYENGQKKSEANSKGGKDGLRTEWYENGQKKQEENYKDGKVMTVVVWKPNGEKCPVTNVVDGNGAWVVYNDDGTEAYRMTYEDGEDETSPTAPPP